MNIKDLVLRHFPTSTDDEIESILWCCTGWPCFFITKEGQSVEDCTDQQLKEIAEKSNHDPHQACVIAHQELDEAMEHGRAIWGKNEF